MNMIKDRIGRHEVPSPINHNYYNLRKKTKKTKHVHLLEKISSVKALFCGVSG